MSLPFLYRPAGPPEFVGPGPTNREGPPVGTGMNRKWVLGLASAASVMVALDATVVTTALSRIRLDLGASIEQLEWTVNAYSLSFAVLLMTGSVLANRFGRRKVFTTGLALFTAASVACALAPGVGWLIAARAVAGYRRGPGDAVGDGIAQCRLSAAGTAASAGAVRRTHRARGGGWSVVGGAGDTGARLAVDLLAQPPRSA